MKTIRQTQPSNEIREIKLSLVDFIYLVLLPPKPLLHGSQCKGLADINHFRLHPQHPPFREYLVSIANNISGIPKCLKIYKSRIDEAKNTVESLCATTSQLSWQYSVILGKMMEKANKFARGHQLKR